MLNKLIYEHRLILAPYLKALENASGDEALQQIQHLELLLDQNSEQRETLTKLMAQGYIDQILYNQETNALLLQAETYRSDIEAITICMTGDSAKVKSIVWRCISRLESTGLECHARTINELVLQDVVVKAINQMLDDKSSYQAQLQLNIAAVIRASQATAIDSIDEKLMALQQELIQKANSKEDYDEIADEIFRLRELRQKTTVDTAVRDEQIKRFSFS